MEVELQNSSYGSIDNSKPLLSQKNYSTSIQYQPLSEVKYESLNEIHLDFSRVKPFQGGLRNNRSFDNNNNHITLNTSSISPRLSSSSLNNMNSSDISSMSNLLSTATIKNKNYLNSISNNSKVNNDTNNKSSIYMSSSLHSNIIHNSNSNSNSNSNNNNNNSDGNSNNDLSLKARMKRISGQNVFIDTKFRNEVSSSVISSANTTFNATASINPNQNANSENTPSTDVTLESPFLFRSFDDTLTPTSNTPTNSTATPKTANTSHSAIQLFKSIISPIVKKIEENSNTNQEIDELSINNNQNNNNDTKINSNSEINDSDSNLEKSRVIPQNTSLTNSHASSYNSQTPTFKSFQNFDHLKDQLEKSIKEHSNIESDETTEYSREQMIRNQFSEQYREEFNNNVNVSPFKKGNSYIFPIGKEDDPFNPYNNPNYHPQALEDNNDPFLSIMNNQPQVDKVQDFHFNNHTTNSKKIDWQLKTDSEKYISRLEFKMNKVKKAPKDIVVEIPDYDDDENEYSSLMDEESELISDDDSINQPLIRRSDAGTKIRRRKRIMHAIRDNKKFVICLFTILFLLVIYLTMTFI